MKLGKTEYNTIHVWMIRHHKKSGKCQICTRSTKTQWSNKDGKYDKHTFDSWQELCAKCHRQYDMIVLGATFGRRADRLALAVKEEWPQYWDGHAKARARLETYAWYVG